MFAQTRLIVVSQRFHLSRAIFLAREAGIEAWGFEAQDVKRATASSPELRRYPSALRAYVDVWFDTPPKYTGARIVIGKDPPN